MNYKQQYLGDFKPDERSIRLYEKLKQYYLDTPDSMSNKGAMPIYKEFKKWCLENGYTLSEVNRMKRSYNFNV